MLQHAIQTGRKAAGPAQAATGPLADAGFPLVVEITEDGQAPVLSPAKYITVMKLDMATFAQNAHVHRNTVARAPAAQSIQKHLRENLRVMAAAWNAAGRDITRAITWFRNEPLPAFDYKTAETLVAEGRSDDVIRLIESYEAGPAG
jgi:hypothetical protein